MPDSIDALADLVKGTLRRLGRGKWTDLTGDLQEYHMMPQILQKGKIDMCESWGDQFNVMTDDNQSARNTGFYSVDAITAPDVMIQGTIPLRHTEAHYAYDVVEFKVNRSAQRVFDHIKSKRAQGYVSLAKRMEIDGWSKPLDSTDEKTPFGMFYWLVSKKTGASAPTGAGEFGGANPTGFTSGAANINSTTYPRWANWTHSWNSVTPNDLIKKLVKAANFTNFISPIVMPTYATGKERVCYVGKYDVKAEMDAIAKSQNQSIGSDLDWHDGKARILSHPIRWVPQLESNTDQPVMLIDWSVFKPVFLEGDYMEETGPIRKDGQHRVLVVWIDNTWNIRCYDRRRLAILIKA
jgi:hypothetical protein